MSVPEAPKIIETPNHFWIGAVDIPFALQEPAKVERISENYVKVTKTFIAKDYEYSDNSNFYEFINPNGSNN